MTRETKTAAELAALIKAELPVPGGDIIVTREATVGWTATVTGAPAKSFDVQLKADVIAARLRQQFDLR